jgi:protein-export membrane protein SecD
VATLYDFTGLTGAQLQKSRLMFDNVTNKPIIALDYNDDGKKILAEVTENNIGKVMAIFLDGQVISAPVINSKIDAGQAVITGDFTAQEARDLVRNLNFGALPLPIKLIETQTIGPTLGKETLNAGVEALFFAFVLISIFMLFMYRLPGLIAAFALIFYATIMLLLFKLIPVTLTAAGIAGFILSLGMAVDANVLVFERMKEEIKKGLSRKSAVEEGFRRAWTSIRDSNISTIITSLVLYSLKSYFSRTKAHLNRFYGSSLGSHP